MASAEDITASIKNLDLGSSLQPSPPNIVAKTTSLANNDFQETQRSKSESQTSSSSGRGRKKKSSNPRPPKTQTEKHPAKSPPEFVPTNEPKLIEKRYQPKGSQIKTQADFDALFASIPRASRDPRTHTKTSKQKPLPTQAQLAGKPLSGKNPVKNEATSSTQHHQRSIINTAEYCSVKLHICCSSLGSESSEEILGVSKTFETANIRAEEYVESWGVKKSDIVDIQSSIGCNALAKRRRWPSGVSEIRVGGKWVKIFPYEVASSENEIKDVYLALDRGAGLFIVGVFIEKNAAWEACKKYRDQLAYCSEVEGQMQWVDEDGMFHCKGRIGGRAHHWFVVRYI